MVRLFVALEIPSALRQRLSLFGGGIPGAHWSTPENLHITLRFIGEVDEARARLIDGALMAVHGSPFHLEISGFGTFSQGRYARTLWAGVERSERLFRLRDKIEWALVREGLDPERRKFQPHLSLARLSRDTPIQKVQDFIAGNNLYRTGFEVAHFTLFSSRLGNGDPVYVAEAEYPLDL